MLAYDLFKLINETIDEVYDDLMMAHEYDKASLIVNLQSKINGKVLEAMEKDK
jgi:hypothetical protein